MHTSHSQGRDAGLVSIAFPLEINTSPAVALFSILKRMVLQAQTDLIDVSTHETNAIVTFLTLMVFSGVLVALKVL